MLFTANHRILTLFFDKPRPGYPHTAFQFQELSGQIRFGLRTRAVEIYKLEALASIPFAAII